MREDNFEINQQKENGLLTSNRAADLANDFGYPIRDKKFLSTDDFVDLLTNFDNKNIVKSIPDGRKENVYYILSENDNLLRTSKGKSRQYPDDCGAWDNGRTVNTPFVIR